MGAFTPAAALWFALVVYSYSHGMGAMYVTMYVVFDALSPSLHPQRGFIPGLFWWLLSVGR